MSEGNEKIATLTRNHLEDTARLDAELAKERNLVQDQTENIRLLTEQMKKKQSDVNYANRELDKIKTQFEEAERVGGELFVSNQAELSQIYSVFENVMNGEYRMYSVLSKCYFMDIIQIVRRNINIEYPLYSQCNSKFKNSNSLNNS